MQLRVSSLCILMFLVTIPVVAQQKKPLDHDDVNAWLRMSDVEMSRNGRWVAWTEAPDRGDGTLIVSSADGETTYRIARGQDGAFSGDNRFLLFRIVPQADSVRQKKLDDVPKDKMPADSLGILRLADGSIERIADVASFGVSDEAGSLAWWKLTERATKALAEADTTAEKQGEEESEEEKKDKAKGVRATFRHLGSNHTATADHVTDIASYPKGTVVVFLRESEPGEDDGVYVIGGSVLEERTISTGTGNYTKLTLDEQGERIAFLSNRDDFGSDEPEYTLFVGDLNKVAAAATTGSAGMPDGWVVSSNGTVSFSDNGQRVFFGTAPRPEPEPEDDDVLDEEKVSLDIWNWKDPLLQPMQLVQADQERKRSFQAVAHLDAGTIVQLATEDIPSVSVAGKGNGAVALGVTNMPYRQEISWEFPVRQDTWIIDTVTGERRMVLEAVLDSPDLSPEGRYLTWWERSIGHWMLMDVASGSIVNLTEGAPHSFVDHLDDRAYDPSPYGSAGWTEGDQEFIIYDEFDIWAASPDGSLRPVTGGAGRAAGIELRVQRLDREEPFLDAEEEWMLRALDLETMDGGFWEVDPRGGKAEPIVMSAHSYTIREKAEDADVLLFERESYVEAPDLRVADLDFRRPVRLSNMNPQQSGFNWGTNELVEWISLDGQPLKGILYKPEGFDASRPYPMMVYFYEKYSRNLHNHYAPSAGGSSINFTFYTSRGYLVFVPDIPYKTGYPGESAMNAVMPGITSLIEKGFVDRKRIGVQGHSWGGYQIAYMVTQTDLFAAAEAGAPVSNMTSAYGGIRWASGMSRMFQYERTQSRIGGTLWDAQQRYIHNSPLFQADKVRTPVLMMHNDEDGAVPWYQGIEYFVALRRLGKPVWMINYNGAGHGLSDLDERRDWQRRMQQFFDHYLMDAPAPVWLDQGVPAVQKGRTTGFEYVDNE